MGREGKVVWLGPYDGEAAIHVRVSHTYCFKVSDNIVLYSAAEAEALEERASEVGWWSDLADCPGVYRVTVKEDEEGELTYSSTTWEAAFADEDPGEAAVAEYLRELEETWDACEDAAGRKSECILVRRTRPGRQWVIEIGPTGRHCLVGYDKHEGLLGSLQKARAKLEPPEPAVEEMTVEECADEANRLTPSFRHPLHASYLSDGTWGLFSINGRQYGDGATCLEAWQAAVRNLREGDDASED